LRLYEEVLTALAATRRHAGRWPRSCVVACLHRAGLLAWGGGPPPYRLGVIRSRGTLLGPIALTVVQLQIPGRTWRDMGERLPGCNRHLAAAFPSGTNAICGWRRTGWPRTGILRLQITIYLLRAKGAVCSIGTVPNIVRYATVDSRMARSIVMIATTVS